MPNVQNIHFMIISFLAFYRPQPLQNDGKYGLADVELSGYCCLCPRWMCLHEAEYPLVTQSLLFMCVFTFNHIDIIWVA